MMPTRLKLIALHLPRQRWVVWLAVCLALFAALAPGVSHAVRAVSSMPGAAQAAWIEICTSTGPRWMALPGLTTAAAPIEADRAAEFATSAAPDIQRDPQADSSAGGSSPASGLALEHCPFCLLMADRLAPPNASTTLIFVAPGHAVRPINSPVLTPPVRPLAAAQPRGPPAP